MVAVALTCVMCGTGFFARSDAVYCSPACRQKAHRARQAGRIAEVAGRNCPKHGSERLLRKPDVAGTFQRARRELARAQDLCRKAAESLQQAATTPQRLVRGRPTVADPAMTPRRSQGQSATTFTDTEGASLLRS